MNSSDCAKRVLLALSTDDTGRTQAALSQELNIAVEQLSPVITGLAHNRYLTRDFNTPGILVRLTDEGRRWMSGPSAAVTAARSTPSASGGSDASTFNEDMMAAERDVDVLSMTDRRVKRPTSRSNASSGSDQDAASRVVKIVRRPRRAIPAA